MYEINPKFKFSEIQFFIWDIFYEGVKNEQHNWRDCDVATNRDANLKDFQIDARCTTLSANQSAASERIRKNLPEACSI